MRIAPVPLFFHQLINNDTSWRDEMVRQAGKMAEITHKHPLGILPASLLTYLIEKLMGTESPTSAQIATMIREGLYYLRNLYPEWSQYITELQDLMDKTIQTANTDSTDQEAIRQLGEGWVADEALAIALLCVLRYPNDFEKAVVAAVNHSGDSDSTGSITGNIVGAIVGYESIPHYYKDNLELRWLIEEIATDLATEIPVGAYMDCYDTPEKCRWMQKYVDLPKNTF